MHHISIITQFSGKSVWHNVSVSIVHFAFCCCHKILIDNCNGLDSLQINKRNVFLINFFSVYRRGVIHTPGVLFRRKNQAKLLKTKNNNKRRTSCVCSSFSMFNCFDCVLWIISGRKKMCRTCNAWKTYIHDWSELFSRLGNIWIFQFPTTDIDRLFSFRWGEVNSLAIFYAENVNETKRKTTGSRTLQRMLMLCNLTDVENPQKSGTLRKRHTHTRRMQTEYWPKKNGRATTFWA